VDIDWQSPDPAMWRARRTLLGTVAILVLVLVVVVVALTAGLVAVVIGLVVVVGMTVATGGLLYRRYCAWGYAEREDDLLIRRGVMIRRLTVVPYGRMQFVDVTAGPVDRLFGLSTVQLHTAAAATDAKIPGLTNATAQRLRDQLASLGEAKAAGL
jgi:hypothetical protein